MEAIIIKQGGSIENIKSDIRKLVSSCKAQNDSFAVSFSGGLMNYVWLDDRHKREYDYFQISDLVIDDISYYSSEATYTLFIKIKCKITYRLDTSSYSGWDKDMRFITKDKSILVQLKKLFEVLIQFYKSINEG
jgi:hypothetical protein